MSQVHLCTDDWQENAPAYVFWQVNLDAARISFCGWYLKEVMAISPPDASAWHPGRGAGGEAE